MAVIAWQKVKLAVTEIQSRTISTTVVTTTGISGTLINIYRSTNASVPSGVGGHVPIL